MHEHNLSTILLAAQGWSELFTGAMASGKLDGVTAKTQIDVLVSLALNGAQNMGSLSHRLERAPEQISRTVRELREQGLVDCERSSENHRMIIAALTDEGRERVEPYVMQMHEFVRDYLAKIDSPDREWLLTVAEKTIDVMRQHPVDTRAESHECAPDPVFVPGTGFGAPVDAQMVRAAKYGEDDDIEQLDLSTAQDDASMLAATTGGIADTVPHNRPATVRDNSSEAV